MNTLVRLLISYVVIFVLFWLAVVGLGGGVGPVEFYILLTVAVVAAAFRTRTILRTRPASEVRR